jgi:hypothetical protein
MKLSKDSKGNLVVVTQMGPRHLGSAADINPEAWASLLLDPLFGGGGTFRFFIMLKHKTQLE